MLHRAVAWFKSRLAILGQPMEQCKSTRRRSHRPAATRSHDHRVSALLGNPNNRMVNRDELHVFQNARCLSESPAIGGTALPTDSLKHTHSWFGQSVAHLNLVLGYDMLTEAVTNLRELNPQARNVALSDFVPLDEPQNRTGG